jgi:hypothetical protein
MSFSANSEQAATPKADDKIREADTISGLRSEQPTFSRIEGDEPKDIDHADDGQPFGSEIDKQRSAGAEPIDRAAAPIAPTIADEAYTQPIHSL